MPSYSNVNIKIWSLMCRKEIPCWGIIELPAEQHLPKQKKAFTYCFIKIDALTRKYWMK